jgi:hypothetical protein
VIPLFGQLAGRAFLHRLGMWAMVCFVMLHVYAAIREDIMGRQSIVSTMIRLPHVRAHVARAGKGLPPACGHKSCAAACPFLPTCQPLQL